MSPFPYNNPQWRNNIESNYIERIQNISHYCNNYYNYPSEISQRHYIKSKSFRPKNKLPNHFELKHEYDQRIKYYNQWRHPLGVRF